MKAICLAILLLPTAWFLPQSSTSEIYRATSPATVLIQTGQAVGSGFIVQSNGTIVTSWHVVADAERVGVKTQSGEIYDDVYLLAKDERKDVAILRIAAFDLPVVDLGNSNDVQPGDAAERVNKFETPAFGI